MLNETPWDPSPAYPDQRFRAFEPAFGGLQIMNSAVRKLADGIIATQKREIGEMKQLIKRLKQQ